MKLKVVPFEYLITKTIGTTEEKIKKLAVVYTKIKSVYDKHHQIIEVYPVSTICTVRR